MSADQVQTIIESAKRLLEHDDDKVRSEARTIIRATEELRADDPHWTETHGEELEKLR